MKIYFDGQDHEIPPGKTSIEVYESLMLDELVRFCQEHGIHLSEVVISSAGDPYLPTPIDWVRS